MNQFTELFNNIMGTVMQKEFHEEQECEENNFILKKREKGFIVLDFRQRQWAYL